MEEVKRITYEILGVKGLSQARSRKRWLKIEWEKTKRYLAVKKKTVAKDCEIAFLTLHFALCISFFKVWFHVQIGNYAEHARRGIT